jgi:hypothetical protein
VPLAVIIAQELKERMTPRVEKQRRWAQRIMPLRSSAPAPAQPAPISPEAGRRPIRVSTVRTLTPSSSPPRTVTPAACIRFWREGGRTSCGEHGG